jgi:hypothetical protein
MWQRRKKQQLTPDQVNRLDQLGFSWDPFAEQWEVTGCTFLGHPM